MMWEIRLYDSELFWNDDYNSMWLLKKIEGKKGLDINSLLIADSKTYRIYAICPKKKVVAVEEIDDIEEKPTMTYGERFTCPYCKEIDEDSFELLADEDVVDGVDAFSFKILESNLHPKTINEKRKFYISTFNTIEYGYNVRLSNFTYRNSLLAEGRVSGMKNNGVESNVNSNKHNSDEEYNDKNIAKLNLFLLINNAQYYVYCFFNKYGEAIYVGKTNNLTYRMIDHFNNGHLSDEVYDEVTSVEYQILLSKVEMDIMELYYINKWKPKHNTMNKSNERVSITIDNKNRWYKYNIHQRSHDNLIENNLEK